MVKPGVRIIECKDAEDLVIRTSPHLSTSLVPEAGEWLFRGQGSAGWGLVPASQRDSSPLKRMCTSEISLRKTEALAALQFLTHADRCGLPLPEDSQALRTSLEHHVTGDALDWPPPQALSLLGLGQHYGLPTRLLDWTEDPLLAAFFALEHRVLSPTESASGDNSDPIAVWAINRVAFVRTMHHAFKMTLPGKLEIVAAPTATNPFLRAQRAMFTLWRPDCGEDDLFRPPLPASVDDLLAEHGGRLNDSCFLCFTLPGEMTEALRKTLNAAGITAATIYPSYQSASREAVIDVCNPWKGFRQYPTSV